MSYYSHRSFNRRAYSRNFYRKKRYGYAFNTEMIIFASVIFFVVFFLTQKLQLNLQTAVYLIFGFFGLILGILLCIAAYMSYKKQQKWRALQVSQIDRLRGVDFEKYLVGLLRFKGFTNVRLTPPQNDKGADVLAESEGLTYSIQAKQYNNWKKVGVAAINEAIGSSRYYHCDVAMVITTGYFTRQAIDHVKQSGAVLVDRDVLLEWITEYLASQENSVSWWKRF